MRTKEEKEEHIKKTIEIAENHKKSSNSGMEKFCLRSACNMLVRISVEEYSNPENAVLYLKQQKLPEYLVRFFDLNKDIYKKFKESPKHPATAVTTDINMVHFAWLMSMYDEAEVMASISTDENVWKYYPVSRIWKDYHRMVLAFVSHKVYEPQPPKLKGYEKHWLPYIHLMAAFTKSHDIGDALSEIEESFIKRNRDKRLENYPSFDGDGMAPVKWDLRKVSILQYGNKFYGYS